MISENLLLHYGAELKQYRKNQKLFTEGEIARAFFQVKTGCIKMYNLSEEGKEFVQGMFNGGEQFAEPPLLLNKPYPASAVAVDRSSVYILPKQKFLQLLLENPAVHMEFSAEIAGRLYYKSMMAKEMSMYDAEHRIYTLLHYLQQQYGSPGNEYEVTLTRQEIANLTGLRVETVIRTMKTMVQQKKLKQKGRKILL